LLRLPHAAFIQQILNDFRFFSTWPLSDLESRAVIRLNRRMLRIGISGWTYKGWRGQFYPPGLRQKDELAFSSRAFNSIEINGSFYSMQRPSSYQAWHESTPADFVFAIKGPRFITHMKKLAGVETALANFYASGVLCLREKTGPFLWQLPPQLGFDAGRLERFFDQLPRDTEAAARLARRHDERFRGRVFTESDVKLPLRHCLEVRHPSFLDARFFELLRSQEIAFVLADTAGRWPYAEDFTADFVYIRLHGAEQLYVSGYDDSELEWWARRIRLWARGKQPADAKLVDKRRAGKGDTKKDVYVYFDNDAKVKAPGDAARLARSLGVKWAAG
jgi:uncharacterized protein YecE (DUF72 family)